MRTTPNSKEIDVQFVLNTWRPKSKSIKLYSNKDHLIGELIDRLSHGKRVFVASNSKAEVDRLLNGIEKHWKDLRLPTLRMIAITSENSVKPEVQNFIENIKTEILKYDLVLSSPSMSTGVDISFDLDEAKVDAVFGIFETRINIHTEIDQQISRVRNPKEVGVWVSPARFNFETQFEVVRSDALRSRLSKVVVSLADLIDGANLQATSSDFLTLATLVTVGRRASINALKNNFIEYKKRQGVAIHPVEKEDVAIDVGADISDWGKRLSDEAYAQSILGADLITYDEFQRYIERLKEDPAGVPDRAKKAAIRRSIEWFYLQPVSQELIELDDRGKFRSKMLRFNRLTHPTLLKSMKRESLLAMESMGKTGLSVRKVADADLYLIRYLFRKCPFMKKGQFVSDVEFSSADLGDFVTECNKLKRVIEGQFEIVVRSDLATKPVSQLKPFLKHIGLDVAEVRAAVSQGKKTRIYQIDPLALEVANSVSNMINIRNEDQDDCL